MMKVEFIGRFTEKRKLTQDEEAAEHLKRLTTTDYIPPSNIKYTYDPITIDLDNIDDWMRLDNNHTQIQMKKGNSYIIKIPYLSFCRVYEDLTGNIIRVINVVDEINEEVKSQTYIGNGEDYIA